MSGIARLMLRRPRVWLLDEPTAALDQAFETRALQVVMRNVAPRDTLVIATHRPGAIAFASRIIVMQQGRIVLDGERDRVLAALRTNAERAGQRNEPNSAVAA